MDRDSNSFRHVSYLSLEDELDLGRWEGDGGAPAPLTDEDDDAVKPVINRSDASPTRDNLQHFEPPGRPA